MSEGTPITSTKYMDAQYYPKLKTVLIQAKADYVPEADFKETFNTVKRFIGSNKVEKTIFDKSRLKVFHQDSMTWYHVEWKAELLHLYGIKSHRKILPDDDLFKQSVNIGREKIAREHNNFDFNDYDIQYKNSLKEALED